MDVEESPVFFILFIVILVVIVGWGMKQVKPRTMTRPRLYVSGEFSGQMELDFRLPYKRFRELYPYSKMTYQEYKQLQMRNAFRRAVSSQKNKRMVR